MHTRPCAVFRTGNWHFQKAAELYEVGSEITSNSLIREFFQAFSGVCLVRGKGVVQGMKKGWSLMCVSVQSNKDGGWFALGECYRYGYGVKKNLNEAVQGYGNAIRVADFADAKFMAHYV